MIHAKVMQGRTLKKCAPEGEMKLGMIPLLSKNSSPMGKTNGPTI